MEERNARFYFSVGDDSAGGKILAVVREQDENRFSSKRKWVGVSRRSKTLIRKKVNHARINNIGLSLQRLDVIGINKYFNIQFNKAGRKNISIS